MPREKKQYICIPQVLQHTVYYGSTPLQALASVLHLNFSTCAVNAVELQQKEGVAGMKGNLVLGRVREGGNPQWEQSGSDFRDTTCCY